jgi:hypothetical protein
MGEVGSDEVTFQILTFASVPSMSTARDQALHGSNPVGVADTVPMPVSRVTVPPPATRTTAVGAPSGYCIANESSDLGLAQLSTTPIVCSECMGRVGSP